jgi:hypothetical protein
VLAFVGLELGINIAFALLYLAAILDRFQTQPI